MRGPDLRLKYTCSRPNGNKEVEAQADAAEIASPALTLMEPHSSQSSPATLNAPALSWPPRGPLYWPPQLL
jgi:hypothetical protein